MRVQRVQTSWMMRIKVAGIATLCTLGLALAGCGGQDDADTGTGVTGDAQQTQQQEQARRAVSEVLGRGPTVDAGVALRERLQRWKDGLDTQMAGQRELLVEIREEAPSIDGDVGETFSDGPCYDGTLPRANTDFVSKPSGDTKADVKQSDKSLLDVERDAQEALDTLAALDNPEDAATEEDERRVREMMIAARDERQLLLKVYEDLVAFADAAERENDLLKAEATRLRQAAGCQMG